MPWRGQLTPLGRLTSTKIPKVLLLLSPGPRHESELLVRACPQGQRRESEYLHFDTLPGRAREEFYQRRHTALERAREWVLGTLQHPHEGLAV